MGVEKIIALAVLIVGLSIAYTLIFVFPYNKSSTSDLQGMWQRKNPEEIKKQLDTCLNDVSSRLKSVNLKNLTLDEIKKTLTDAEKEKSQCIEKYK